MPSYILIKVYSPTLPPKDAQELSNLHSSPKAWHDISNINIYLQVTYTPQIVGIIYPIQIYISENVLTFIPQVLAWYIQYEQVYSTDIYSPNCWQHLSNTNMHFYDTLLISSFVHQYLQITI